MSRVEPLDPGPLRQWWWQTTQHARLVVLAGLTVLAMALTAVATFALPHGDAPRAAAQPPTAPRASEDSRASSTAPAEGDLTVTVTTVPAVDLVTGEDTAHQLVTIKVVGIAPASTCRTAEALTAATELLGGKQVRVPGGENATPDPNGRVVATVVLPDGRDYAHTAVGGGLATTDPTQPAPNEGDLAAAEATARQAGQGAWQPCPTGQPDGQQPDGTATEDQQAGGSGTPPPPDDPPPNDDPQPPPTTETTTPPDDIQRGVREGDPCAPEGAIGITDRGQVVVCRDGQGHHDGLRWRRR